MYESTAASRAGTLGVLLLLCGLGPWACTPKRFSYDYGKEPNPASDSYVVGPSDVLRVNVWRDPDLSGEVQVRPDGKATLPLLGEVVAAGKTADQIRDDIRERLSEYMDGAVVTVAVAQTNSYFFTVSGNVNKPGRYSPGMYVTVVEALSLAGEPNPFADTEGIVILRGGSGEDTRRIPINYDTLLTATDLRQNVVVLRGDVILVP